MTDQYYGAATAHGILGAIAELLGLYIVLAAGTDTLPRRIRISREAVDAHRAGIVVGSNSHGSTDLLCLVRRGSLNVENSSLGGCRSMKADRTS